MSDESIAPAPLSPSTIDVGPQDTSSDDLQDDADAGWLSVDWNMVRAERISGWIFFAVVCLAAGGTLIAVTAFNWPPGIVVGLLWLGFILLAAFLVWVVHFLPALQYKHLSYRLGKLGLEIRRGIFWKKRVTVPISRVQHTDVAQGPLQRRFDVGKVIVYTAGTQNASVELDGLNFTVAGKLRDSLVAHSEAADGV